MNNKKQKITAISPVRDMLKRLAWLVVSLFCIAYLLLFMESFSGVIKYWAENYDKYWWAKFAPTFQFAFSLALMPFSMLSLYKVIRRPTSELDTTSSKKNI